MIGEGGRFRSAHSNSGQHRHLEDTDRPRVHATDQPFTDGWKSFSGHSFTSVLDYPMLSIGLGLVQHPEADCTTRSE